MSPKSIISSLLLATILLVSFAQAESPEEKFEKALASCSNQCQSTVKSCIVNQAILKLINEKKYCDAIKYKSDSFSTKTCVEKGKGCTDAEYNKLKDAVCGGVATAVSIGAILVGVVSSWLGKAGN